tara:strand:- start:1914 stop:2195 length:282 start_codon:yes stop_codon:yes gene_type:complete
MNKFNEQQRKKILSPYVHKLQDNNFIAIERNRILQFKHGKIPSYCAWDEDSVAAESDDEKIKWFEELIEAIREMNSFYSEISQKYIGPSADES